MWRKGQMTATFSCGIKPLRTSLGSGRATAVSSTSLNPTLSFHFSLSVALTRPSSCSNPIRPRQRGPSRHRELLKKTKSSDEIPTLAAGGYGRMPFDSMTYWFISGYRGTTIRRRVNVMSSRSLCMHFCFFVPIFRLDLDMGAVYVPLLDELACMIWMYLSLLVH